MPSMDFIPKPICKKHIGTWKREYQNEFPLTLITGNPRRCFICNFNKKDKNKAAKQNYSASKIKGFNRHHDHIFNGKENEHV